MKFMQNASIAKYYDKWVNSDPFDIGMATHAALS